MTHSTVHMSDVAEAEQRAEQAEASFHDAFVAARDDPGAKLIAKALQLGFARLELATLRAANTTKSS